MKNFGLKTNKLHRIIAATICMVMLLGLVFQVTLFSAPEGEKKQAEQAVTRVADASTINSWQEYYKDETDTSNVGKIWTDKTVSAGELELVESGLDMVPEEDNFMVGLSALSSSKSVVLEAAIPVDVMLVLDISGSMVEGQDDKKISMLVEATNNTIRNILDMNKDNRVGVVLYSGAKEDNTPSGRDTASCAMPLDRYTTTEQTYFRSIPFNFDTGENSRVEISENVRNSKKESPEQWLNSEKLYYDVDGNTYIQNGLMEAFDRLTPKSKEEVEGRIPVITLMSDGAPTAARTQYTERGESTVGYGTTTDIRMAFLTQLSAAWIKKSLRDCYSKQPLFYTVGVLTNTDEDERTYAEMVLNPSNSTVDDDLNRWWDEFLSAEINTTVELKIGDTPQLNVKKVDEKLKEDTDRYYVDEFFNAKSAEDLKTKFEELVERIKIESSEFPTEEDENHLNYSGYLTFEDKIGKYMSVERVNGVMYGGKMHEGERFAQKFDKDTAGEKKASYEDREEFLKSLMERLNITLEQAEALLLNAQEQEQISYGKQQINNYIAWYAEEDGSYIKPYKNGENPPTNAKFLNKSYFYYGSSSGTIAGERLMYLGVRIEETLEENVNERKQVVRFSIPASLIPLVKYQITRNAENEAESYTEKSPAEPVHLFYEVGLKDEINEYDLSAVSAKYEHMETDSTSEKVAAFYQSLWLNSSEVSEAETAVQFIVSEQNEYYYYTEEAEIYKKIGEDKYEPYKGETCPKPDDENEYYSEKIIYDLDLNGGGKKVKIPIDKASLVERLERKENGNWVIKAGTFRYERLEQKNKNSDNNPNGNMTDTVDYIFKTIIKKSQGVYRGDSEENSVENGMVSVYLGNTGKTVIKQGKIVVSKSVNGFFEGDNENTGFNFEINLNSLEGEKVPNAIKGRKNTQTLDSLCVIEDGRIKFTLKDKETVEFWLPVGKLVSVEEVGEKEQKYETTMKVTQKGYESDPIKTKKVENIEIVRQLVASVAAGNGYNPPAEIILLYKIDGLTKKGIGGAVFSLYKLECLDPENHTDEMHNKIIQKGVGENQGCWQRVGEATSIENTGYLKFVNDTGEIIKFTKDTYRLVEESAPKGYSRSVGQWNIIVVPGGNTRVTFEEILGNNGEKPTAILQNENRYEITNYKPINPPITGGRGIDRFLILGVIVAISGLMITVHLVLQRKRGKL